MGRAEESRAFLDAIREAPDDDAPRLVYADWLDDHGEPARAEFIRVQCERARLPAYGERGAELWSRENELLEANGAAWLGPLAEKLHHDTFRRGFPEDLTLCPEEMVALAKEFDARVPAGRVTLFGDYNDPEIETLTTCLHMGWVAGLKFRYPPVTDTGLELVANAVNLQYLAELSVEMGHFTTNGMRALTTSPHREALRRLDLHHNRHHAAPPAAADALAAPGVLFRLRSLSLDSYSLGPAGAAVLAGTANLAEVKDLRLPLNELGDEGAIALARSPHLRGLSSLHLTSNGVTSRSVRELADSPLLDGIRALDLAINKVGDEGAEALAASPCLAALKRLSLSWTDITDRGAAALAASTHLNNLTTLELLGNGLSNQGSQALFESPNLRRLERISIGAHDGRDTILSRRWQKRLGSGAEV
jgi:uncharacterized protein (TIGR02996 family)